MHKRDEEIKRLIFYAKALGVKVIIRDYNFEDAATWTHDPISIININKKKHTTKTALILSLLHEISHAKFHIVEDRPLPDGTGSSQKLPKRVRKKWRDFEVESLELMPEIAKEVGIEVPYNKIIMAKELDQWVYDFYYEIGYFPNFKEMKGKEKELKLKYKGEKNDGK